MNPSFPEKLQLQTKEKGEQEKNRWDYVQSRGSNER